jgi:hypothetical protein
MLTGSTKKTNTIKRNVGYLSNHFDENWRLVLRYGCIYAKISYHQLKTSPHNL